MSQTVLTNNHAEILPEEVEPPSPSRCVSNLAAQDQVECSCLTDRIQDTIPEANKKTKVPSLTLASSVRFGSEARKFRRRFFPTATQADWNDWHWQIQHRITGLAQLSRIIRLSPEERAAMDGSGQRLSLNITPQYLSLVDPDDPDQPIRRCVVPVVNEHIAGPGESDDPLSEERDLVAPGLVHRYPDRVLFLVTGFCSTNCRYCTRSRLVGHEHGTSRYSRRNLEKALDYIAATPAVRDVLISGGDPLTLSDERLEWILAGLRSIRHVEIIRIGTKAPVVLPQRITSDLVKMLKRYHPLFMSIHFTHPEELTQETGRACERLADAGIPLGSQTVLLAGINDNAATMKDLVHALLKVRVRPYYLYQCDPITGSAHFRTPVSRGLEIIQGLRGYTSGYAIPNYVIDAPGGGGKIPLCPDAVAGQDGCNLALRNYAGQTYYYPDTAGGVASEMI
ncbi:MAG: KamA family radical SAM protein [Deltaproteobacteria bacterium]|nr:KamA family radical SAM protein [Deltaproteobacteria bacterium]